tara:strand:+ start:536 stop:988 length:453 start_codon:yes stop_codon:yes gene_type:complete
MPQNGGGKGWKTDPDTGVQVMPELWKNFLEWLLLGPEREPGIQKEWAALNGVHEDSLRRWKRDPRFRREWEARAAELNIHVERVQTVIDAVYREAAQGDVKAASLYLQYIDKFTPKRTLVVDEAEAAALSDDALVAELEGLLDGLRSDGE